MEQEQKKDSKKVVKVPRIKSKAPVRLWVKAVFLGFRRGKETQNENQALLKIQGVNDRKSSAYYFGKRVAYVYKAHNTVRNTKYRVIWGRVTKGHGSNGVVAARFSSNLPPRGMGNTLRVMLYPNRFNQ